MTAAGEAVHVQVLATLSADAQLERLRSLLLDGLTDLRYAFVLDAMLVQAFLAGGVEASRESAQRADAHARAAESVVENARCVQRGADMLRDWTDRVERRELAVAVREREADLTSTLAAILLEALDG